DRSGGDGAPVYRRQVPDELLPGQNRRCVGIRRGRVANRAIAVGLLLGADLPPWRRIHLGIRTRVRLVSRAPAARRFGCRTPPCVRGATGDAHSGQALVRGSRGRAPRGTAARRDAAFTTAAALPPRGAGDTPETRPPCDLWE